MYIDYKMNLKLYLNNFINNYIENVVYPYNYSILSTGLIRNNLSIDEVNKLNNYSINYWNMYISKRRKNEWIKYFKLKKLYKKINL